MNRRIQSNEPQQFDEPLQNAAEHLENMSALLRGVNFAKEIRGPLGIEEGIEALRDILLAMISENRIAIQQRTKKLNREAISTEEPDDLGNGKVRLIGRTPEIPKETLMELRYLWNLLFECLCSVHRDLCVFKSQFFTQQTEQIIDNLNDLRVRKKNEGTFIDLKLRDKLLSEEIIRSRFSDVPDRIMDPKLPWYKVNPK